MSYDVCVEIDAGGPEPVMIGDINYTYNIARMCMEAMGGKTISDFRDAPCSEAGGVLRSAASDIRNNPARYDPFNPPNGWGDRLGCAQFLDEIADLCERAPRGVIKVY